PPAWLPHNLWERLLAISVVPGPLDGVCVQVAKKSLQWENWYNKLFRSALKGLKTLYVSRFTTFEVFCLCSIVPQIPYSNSTPEEWSFKKPRSAQPITAITITAEGKGIPVSIVSIMEGCEADIETALDDAVKQEGWLIIENLQLASEQFLQSLHQKILCAKTIVGTQNENKKFCLWLMTEPGAAISEHFLSTLHKVSWHVLTRVQYIQYCNHLHFFSPSAILSALEQVSEKTWRSVQDLQPLFRSLCFTVCILHGMIQGLLFLPTTGLSQLYPVSCVHLNQAIDCVICIALKSQSTSSNLAHILSKEISSVYTNLVASPEDATYIKSLIHEVMFRTGVVVVGQLAVPIPPANVNPVEYSAWLSDKIPGECTTTTGLLLHRRMERVWNETCSRTNMSNLTNMTIYTRKFKKLKRLRGASSSSSSLFFFALQFGLPSAGHRNPETKTGMSGLRSSLELVSEHLPPLLEVQVESPLEISSYSLSHNTPSVLSETTTEKETTEDSLSDSSEHFFFQECHWMNDSLQHIQHTVQELLQYMLTDSFVIPEHLSEVAAALQEEKVPGSWLHPHGFPTTHSLITWIKDLKRAHNQLIQWLKTAVTSTEKTTGCVSIPLWLGGLVNPGALFLALKYEYAGYHGCFLDEV
uniref:Dynein heavy chain C-terminal domain-containing protein n=1 Tax=Latimeria chalumnae TaxID=7897 RepID=H3B7U7_LATCH